MRLFAWLCAVAACGGGYEGEIWQTSDRTITLAFDGDTARWNVYLGRDPNAQDENTGFYVVLEGTYRNVPNGLVLSLHCASTTTGAGQTCAEPKGDVSCVRDGDTLGCTLDGVASRFEKVAE